MLYVIVLLTNNIKSFKKVLKKIFLSIQFDILLTVRILFILILLRLFSKTKIYYYY